jgi:hypothetical protein
MLSLSGRGDPADPSTIPPRPQAKNCGLPEGQAVRNNPNRENPGNGTKSAGCEIETEKSSLSWRIYYEYMCFIFNALRRLMQYPKTSFRILGQFLLILQGANLPPGDRVE